MARDRVNPIKWERPSEGGTENDFEVPTELDPHEDYINCRGVTIQNETSNDEEVIVDRDALGNMIFIDKILTEGRKLATIEQVKDIVNEGKVFIVYENFQHIVYNKFTIDGEYRIEGTAVVI